MTIGETPKAANRIVRRLRALLLLPNPTPAQEALPEPIPEPPVGTENTILMFGSRRASKPEPEIANIFVEEFPARTISKEEQEAFRTPAYSYNYVKAVCHRLLLKQQVRYPNTGAAFRKGYAFALRDIQAHVKPDLS